MTHHEPERLALQLQELIERRAFLTEFLSSKLHEMLLTDDRAAIQRVLELIDREKTDLEARLEQLRSATLVSSPRRKG